MLDQLFGTHMGPFVSGVISLALAAVGLPALACLVAGKLLFAHDEDDSGKRHEDPENKGDIVSPDPDPRYGERWPAYGTPRAE